TITSAIPPVFASYCSLELPDANDRAELTQHGQAVIELLTEQTPDQPWWLGFLDTGASDVVFSYAPDARHPNAAIARGVALSSARRYDYEPR
ncbi:MAG: hypothetical protein ACRDRO_27860, partial [Pseudonocardiaceae bacterium]